MGWSVTRSKESLVKRKLFVLSGILVLSLCANTTKMFAVGAGGLCSALWSQSCTNGAETSCVSGGVTLECHCSNNRWYCNT